ncbi:10074_t:CDS:2 [Funneliformis geosporum]|uniref:10074_t:CDS:1 n=1 Tax=Funneliformis geosporum TaxID=1117311 RepID=A0A9W4SFW1_9GLOM|nr:10074_t:CDS:2 [Funneliformis geosporum]
MSTNSESIEWLEKNIKEEHIIFFKYTKFKNRIEIGSGGFSKVYSAKWEDDKYFALKSFNFDTVKEIVEEFKLHRIVDFHDNIIRLYGITKDLGSIKLADFGLSKRIGNSNTNRSKSKVQGILPYIDPKRFDHVSNEKCDVYSVGVLLWELSSGKKPFDGYDSFKLFLELSNGKRENIVDGTPEEYSNLYINVDERPTIQRVVETLQSMISPPYSIILDSKVKTVNPSTVEPSQQTILDTNEISRSKLSLIHNLDQLDINDFNDYYLMEGILPDTTNLSSKTSPNNDFNETLISSSKINNMIVEELVELFIKTTNEGKSRDQRRSILDAYLTNHNITIKEIYGWLIKNNSKFSNSNFIFFAGYLNFSGIGTTLDINKASNYFHHSSAQNHSIAQYYLGIFYEKGIGVNKDENKGFGYYDKSAKQGQSIAGKFALGMCYEKGVGIEKNKEMAFYWYQQAANEGHAIARHNLGNFYRLGNFVEKDHREAFGYYNLSAQSGYILAISMLGHCYLEGIGTSVNKKMAFDHYLKAANMEDNIAQYNVAFCLESGIGTTKDLKKAMEWYKKSANSGYNISIKRLENLIVKQKSCC